MSCGVSSYQHSSVSLEFFETVVRYDKFFMVEPQHIPGVLVSGRRADVTCSIRRVLMVPLCLQMAFLDHRGLRNNSPKVRSRVAYLFSRFIKTLQ